MKIHFNQVIPSLVPQQNLIAKIISDLLILQEKLKHPERQSEYFRWGLQSNIERCKALACEYEQTRQEFNAMTIDDMLGIRSEQEIFLEERIPGMFPIFVRMIMYSKGKIIIRKMEDYLQLRSMVRQLPKWDELKEDKKLLEVLLG